MSTTMAKLERVSGLLDKVMQLPLGHPDRLRFLTYAEQVLEGSDQEEYSLPSVKAINRGEPDGTSGASAGAR